MPLRYFMEKLHLDAAELQNRRAFFEIMDDELKRLAGLRAFAENAKTDATHLLERFGRSYDDARSSSPDDSRAQPLSRNRCAARARPARIAHFAARPARLEWNTTCTSGPS